MGRLKLYPSCTNLGRANRLAQFLLSHLMEGSYPFHICEPGVMIARNIDRLGGGLECFDVEFRAKLIFYLSLIDAGMGSMRIASLMIGTLGEYLDLFVPEYFAEYQDILDEKARNSASELLINHESSGGVLSLESPKDRSRHYLQNVIRHRYYLQLGASWFNCTVELARNWGSRVMSLLNGSRSAIGIANILKGREWPAFGPKKSRVLICRSTNVGLCRPDDLSQLGPPIDIHAIMLSVGTRVIDLFDKEFSYTASSVINALHALWAEACVRFNIDVLKLYEALWLWGRGMCRIVNCRNCPLWKKKRGLRCEGRVSTRDYYGDNRGVQRIYPDRIVTPTSQYEFDFYLEAPEVANTGLYEDDPPEIYALMLKMAPRVVQEQLPLLL